MYISFEGRSNMLHFVVERTGKSVREDDIELMFGPFEGWDEIVKVDTDDLATMAVRAGVFLSKTQARKNGLGGPAPHGLHQIGTKKRRFWVWNPQPSDEQVTLKPSFDRSTGWFQ
jgi:hypothetical protein